MKMMNDKFQLRIPRDLKEFFDDHVERCKPLCITNGNEMMRRTLISKANELKEGLKALDHSNELSSKYDSIAPDKRD